MNIINKFPYTLILSVLLFVSCGSSGDSNKMIANAGSDIFIVSPSQVEMNSSKSSSPNNIQYSWELQSKPKKSKATLSNKNISNPTLFIDIDGDYLFELSISDGKETLKDNVKITLNSLCKISRNPKFSISASKKVFQAQIKGLKNDINGTFVYFNHIKSAVKYKISIAIKNEKFGFATNDMEWTDLDIRNNVILQFKSDKSAESRYIFSAHHPYIRDTLVLTSSHFNVGDEILLSLKAYDKNDNLIISSKEISFILGKAYEKNALKVYFTNTSIDDKINLSWCPNNNDKEYILHYGDSFDNLDKTIKIKNSLDLKTSIQYVDKQNARYFALSNNGFFSNTINTIPSTNTNNINFSISKVTFNQSVQIDMDNNSNNTPIIANKAGILRVFTKVENGFSAYKVKVRLNGKNNGKELSPIIKTVILNNSNFNSTDSTNKPITFAINNPDWLKVGTEFYIEIDIDDEIIESNEEDNRYPKEFYKSFDFQNVSLMKVRLVPINPILGYVRIPMSYVSEIKANLESIYPLHEVDVAVNKPFNLVHGTINTVSRLLDVLESVVKYKDEKIIEDSANEDVYYVGVVNNFKFYNYAGIGKLNDNEDINLASLVRINTMTKYSFAETVTHEIGHNHGLRHIDSSDSKSCTIATGVDINYPYNQTRANYGRIGKTSYSNYRNVLYNKNSYHDMMAYCRNLWISDYSYNKIYDFERKIDKLYTRNINRSIVGDNNIKPLINGRVIMGRFDGNIWNITKNYISKSRKDISKTTTNFYLKVVFDDLSKIEIPFSLSDVSHMKIKIFKVFIPSLKNIKSIKVVEK